MKATIGNVFESSNFMYRNLILLSILLQVVNYVSAQMIPYRVGDKWGYSDTSGKILIEPKFVQSEFFEEGTAFIKDDSFYYLIDESGEILTEALNYHGTFKNGLCPVNSKNKKSYYINHKGKDVFNIHFSAAENFSEGLAIVSMKKKLGIINSKGEWVREPDFDSSSLYFKSGFILAKLNGRFIYLNNKGSVLLLPDSVKPAGIFSEGLAAVYVEHKKIVNGTSNISYKLKFIDATGHIVLSEFINDSMDYAEYLNYEKEFKDGKAIVNVPNQLAHDRFFIDKKGKFSPVFSFVQHLGDSMFLGVDGYYMPTIRIYDSSYFVMGNFSIPITSVGVFNEGLLPVQNRAGYWGYCDSYAKEVIPFIYEKVNPFLNGYAIVVQQGKFGVINKKGKAFYRD